MFSAGHLIWIAVSLILIIGGVIFCRLKAPEFEDVIKVCLAFGIVSEAVKFFCVAKILPIVEPVVLPGTGGGTVSYVPAGQYSPYIENAHLPFELCSLQILFFASYLLSKTPSWKRRFRALIFICGIIGGTLGILLSYIAPEYSTVIDFILSLHAWQFFLYHSMVVTAGIYAGFGSDTDISLKDLKGVLAALISLDIISFYINSIFSDPVYVDGKPEGLLYRANFFSSYVNPLGIVLTEKWQWITYLLLRDIVALIMIVMLFFIQTAVRKKESDPASPGNITTGQL